MHDGLYSLVLFINVEASVRNLMLIKFFKRQSNRESTPESSLGKNEFEPLHWNVLIEMIRYR